MAFKIIKTVLALGISLIFFELPAKNNTKQVIVAPNVIEEVHLDDLDLLTGSTFSELAKEQENEGLDFILARVTSGKGDKKHIHYYSAPDINRWVFGKELHLPDLQNKQFKNFNPANKEKITDIEYFQLSPQTQNFEKVPPADIEDSPETFTYYTLIANDPNIDENTRIRHKQMLNTLLNYKHLYEEFEKVLI